MRNVASIELSIMIGYPHLSRKFQVIELESSLKEWVVESVAVITCDNVWIVTLNERGKS